jgi:Ca2+-binding RTX toxin-like protein
MSVITVSNAAQLASAIAHANAGDTISLQKGDYGDLSINNKNFSTDVTITSADAGRPAVFNSVTVNASSGIDFVGVNLSYATTAQTATFTGVVKISNSSDIEFHGGTVKAGLAVSGIAPTATTLDASGNVIGMATARGFSIDNSSHVVVDHTEITQVFRGVVMSDSNYVTLTNNNIHDVRTSPIVGGNDNHLVIDGNKLSSSHPWRWGDGSGEHDHGDFIHLWTMPGKATNTDIQITNNTMTQGSGAPILGIYLDDNTNKLGFTNVTVSNNMLANDNGQGIRLENVFNSKIIDNTLVQTGTGAKDAPGVLITSGSHDLSVSGNITSYVNTMTGSTANAHDNTLVQNLDKTKAGFYDDSLVSKLSGLGAAGAHQVAVDTLSATKMFVATQADMMSFNTAATLSTTVGFKEAAHGAGSQIVMGGAGDDTLVGSSGNDTVVGGTGNDYLTGGSGDDVLVGGAGADMFVFAKGYGGTTGMDTVTDFKAADHDRVNLHSMDANTATASDDDFKFIGTQNFHHVPGELRFYVDGANSIVQGDTNGDGVADFSIKLLNVHSLNSADFLL